MHEHMKKSKPSTGRVSYTNRKGKTYFLCQGTTKTGKPRYYFAREPEGALVAAVPDGFAIRESVNGVVSLVKARPALLLEQEVEEVRAALRKHPQAPRYRVDAQGKRITIYERVGPDLEELARALSRKWGIPGLRENAIAEQAHALEEVHGQFTPVMRFELTDGQQRHFMAQRMCYLGSIDDWIYVEFEKPIAELARDLIPTLGTDEFFELF